MKDLLIVGGGPAGLSAAIYGKRAGLDLAIIEKFAPGGQVMSTYEVENYPGFAQAISGFELVSAMESQAQRLGAEIINADVVSFEKKSECFAIKGASGEIYETKSVILAMGSSYRKLGIPGEKEFTGMGVSYCATCDGAFYREKVTAVVGGGNTALEEAIFLTRFASKVYLIHRRNEFRAEKIVQDRLAKNDKIISICGSTVEKVNGDAKVRSLSMRNLAMNEVSELAVDGLFIFIGYDSNISIVPPEILDASGQVKVDMQMRTPIKGLFAAGDLRTESRRQIVMACADGATAAMSAYDFLNDLNTCE